MQTALMMSGISLPIYSWSLLGEGEKDGGVGRSSCVQLFIPATELLSLKTFPWETASDADLIYGDQRSSGSPRRQISQGLLQTFIPDLQQSGYFLSYQTLPRGTFLRC